MNPAVPPKTLMGFVSISFREQTLADVGQTFRAGRRNPPSRHREAGRKARRRVHPGPDMQRWIVFSLKKQTPWRPRKRTSCRIHRPCQAAF